MTILNTNLNTNDCLNSLFVCSTYICINIDRSVVNIFHTCNLLALFLLHQLSPRFKLCFRKIWPRINSKFHYTYWLDWSIKSFHCKFRFLGHIFILLENSNNKLIELQFSCQLLQKCPRS